jgi:hypothetical protein
LNLKEIAGHGLLLLLVRFMSPAARIALMLRAQGFRLRKRFGCARLPAAA